MTKVSFKKTFFAVHAIVLTIIFMFSACAEAKTTKNEISDATKGVTTPIKNADADATKDVTKVIKISTYTGESNIIAQGIKDDTFKDTDIVFTVSGLTDDIEYTISLGDTEIVKKNATDDGEISVTKGEIKNAFDFFVATASNDNNKEQTIALKVETAGEAKGIAHLFYKPQEIWTWQDLQAMRKDLAGTYVQKADIVFEDKKNNDMGDSADGKGDYNFEPIGKGKQSKGIGAAAAAAVLTTPFTGTFDGGDFTIEKLYIDLSENYAAGLFGSVEGKENEKSTIIARLKNTYVKASISRARNPSNSRYLGILVGKAKNATIIGSSRGKMETDLAYTSTGGLVGHAETSTVIGTSSSQIQLSKSREPTSSSFSEQRLYNVGGLVGNATVSTVIGTSKGRVLLVQSNVAYGGGLVGTGNNLTVVGTSSGNVEIEGPTVAAGGLSGLLFSPSTLIGVSDSRVESTSNMGNMNVYAGGLVGFYRQLENPSITIPIFGVYRGSSVSSITSAGTIYGHSDIDQKPTGTYYNKDAKVTTKDAKVTTKDAQVTTSATISVGTEIENIADTTKANFSNLTPAKYWTFADGEWPCINFDAVLEKEAPGVTVPVKVKDEIKAAAVCDQKQI